MNPGDLFDSPWKILIIAALLIVFFGARKLPDAAHSLGKSMRILKREVHGLHEEEAPIVPTPPTAYQAAPAQLQATAPAPVEDSQAKLDALSRQLADLQQSVAANKASEVR
jgi:sec-independent protein translocase protein TatA